MINQELSLYIQAQLASGMPKDVIKEILIARGGWHPEDVEQAFTALTPGSVAAPTPAPAPVIAPAPKIEPVVQQLVAQTNFFAPKVMTEAATPVQPVTPAPITPAPTPVSTPVTQAQAPVTPAVSPFLKPSPTNPLPQTAPAPVVAPQMQTAPTPVPTQTISPTPAPVQPQTVTQPVMSDITFVKGSMGSPEPVSTTQPKMMSPMEATPTMLASQMEKNQISSSPVPPQSQVAPTTTMSALSQIQPTPMQTPMSQPPTPVQTPVQSFVGMQTHTQQVQQMQQMNDGVQITEKKPRSKLAKVIIGLVILLVLAGLGGGAAYGYFYYVNPSPARAFAAVIPKFKSAHTGHYKATITATFNKNAVSGLIPAPAGLTASDQGVVISQDTTAQGTFTIDGTFDKTDAKNPKSSNTLTIGTTAIPLSITLETRLIGETLYAKVPDLGFLADLLGGNTFGFVPGDWVELSKSEAMTASQIDPMLSALLPTQATTNTVATNAQQDQLVSAFFDSGVITPTVELAKGTVGTTSVHRYQFSVDQQALKTALTKAYAGATGSADNGMVASAIGQFVDGMTVQNGELWIGVWDGKPYRIMFTVKPTGDFANELQSVAFDINFDSFGQPVTITTPVGAKSLMSLIQDAQKKMKDTKIQANLTAVKTRAELYYSVKRTYLGLCSADAGLKTQFASLTNLASPGGVYCKDSARAFAVAAELTTPQSVACVDNTNSVTLMPALPTALACK